MKSRPRKIITRVIVFLLLGAIVNVAVAWGLAARSRELPYIRSYVPTPSESQRIWHEYGFDDWPEAPFGQFETASQDQTQSEQSMTSTFEYFGLEEVTIHRQRLTHVGEGKQRRSTLSTWTVQEIHAGFPLRSMAGGIRNRMTAVGGHLLHVGTIPASTMVGLPAKPDMRLIPGRPAWLGFAINTIFYAAILWILWATLSALRRRRRIKRGLCPACAYPVGTSPVCTECGTALAPRGIEPS